MYLAPLLLAYNSKEMANVYNTEFDIKVRGNIAPVHAVNVHMWN